jgi:isoleucyl-tRNA synthetase
LEVTDRIELAVDATGEVAEAVSLHREWVAGEVLAVEVVLGSVPWPRAPRVEGTIEGNDVLVAVRRVSGD